MENTPSPISNLFLLLDNPIFRGVDAADSSLMRYTRVGIAQKYLFLIV